MPALSLATFEVDATPPIGHPLCGGWIEPARAVDDSLRLKGIVLKGDGLPVVLAALDWTGLRNDAHRWMREVIARAAGTTSDRVSVHCVHPHNAPFGDVEAERLIREHKAPPSFDLEWYDKLLVTIAEEVRLTHLRHKPFDSVGFGTAKIEEVASNRRVVGENGKIKYTRTSATKDPKARAEPEGLVDPVLRTVTFGSKAAPAAALHFYATHPMSYYGDGRVTPDFCGLAREKLQAENKNCFQVYFTGCSGNVTAGKYNDGSKGNREILRDRVYGAMKTALADAKPTACGDFDWRTEPLPCLPRKEASFGEKESLAILKDATKKPAARNNAAFQLAWLKRVDRPVNVNALNLGNVSLLFLPGEPFVEFQLAAPKMAPARKVAVAGYGDGGTGYIPTEKAFFEGGYEPTVALAAPETEAALLKAMEKLLASAR